MTHLNAKTIRFIGRLNQLANDSRDGFIPLSQYDGHQKGIIYADGMPDTDHRSNVTAYPAVNTVAIMSDGSKDITLYQDGADSTEFNVIVYVEEVEEGVNYVYAEVSYLDDELTEQLAKSDLGPVYSRIRIEDGNWRLNS